MPHSSHVVEPQKLSALSKFIFASRWLQLPLYLGLILAQCVYVYHFWVELVDLIRAAMGDATALQHLLDAVSVVASHGKEGAEAIARPSKLNETTIMLVVLGLIDVVMISNLLIMVIVGGYETFVSRLGLQNHPDQPEWLSHVNATVLKVKLAMAIIGISSIHLLKTFINVKSYDAKDLIAQTVIHVVFLMSALAIAYCDQLMTKTQQQANKH
ncbi:TIGR00645 family protein [Undibacterium flavidum]|uniref:UPF0114 protein H8K55_00065 n=1 Tax=Undibacterium flavidum TaxID=2762297 RepID=A0ABR6Y5R1_9BURK|nr:TIGR00645 family protein [Undibacterium flavidum]MBC3871966.1 TIGR00645 family protein [Undibacterium flavidum]